MKNIAVLLCILLCAPAARAGTFEQDYGIGIVHIDLDKAFSLQFYGNVCDEKDFQYGLSWAADSTGTFRMKFLDELDKVFAPEYASFDPEKRRIDLRCLERSGSCYKVMLNNETKLTRWIVVAYNVRFMSWLEFYQSMASIEPITSLHTLAVHKEPRSSSSRRTLYQLGMVTGRIRAKAIQGNWMKVEITLQEGKLQKTRSHTGWILWRNAEMPLITYNLMHC